MATKGTRAFPHVLERHCLEEDVPPPQASEKGSEQPTYIPYPRAMKIFARRLNATADEVAGWVFVGPKDGGLCAYLNANELDPPPRFYFDILTCDDFDYLVPLQACWFREADILSFEPKDRFITGEELLTRWSSSDGIIPGAFIRAKIEESRLIDIHPIYGGTQGTYPNDPTWPPLEKALFVKAHVEAVEQEDDVTPIEAQKQWSPVADDLKTAPQAAGPLPPVHPEPSRADKDALASIAEWRSRVGKSAAEARHSRPGGSREARAKIREIWASGKYTTRERCAEEESAALGISFSTARKALRNTPKPTRS
jgi:hypothetical protein